MHINNISKNIFCWSATLGPAGFAIRSTLRPPFQGDPICCRFLVRTTSVTRAPCEFGFCHPAAPTPSVDNGLAPRHISFNNLFYIKNFVKNFYLFIFANEQLWLLYLYQEDSKDISKVQNIIFILTAKENLTTFDLLDLELLNSMAAYDIVTTFPTQFDIWFLVQGVVNKLH